MPRPDRQLTPRRGWMNDPHGLTWHDGQYHVFFQHVPDSLVWRPDISWGHAVSPDLERWTELEPVLTPDEQDTGCWSGCLVDDAPAGPTILYTSVAGTDLERGRIRGAVPTDGSWATWRKTDLSVEAPAGLHAFRDPFVVAQDGGWRMLVGAGREDGTPAVVSFTSSDLDDWTYDGELAVAPPEQEPWPGEVWECPQLVHVDGAWALIVSVQHRGAGMGVAYTVGELDGGRFTTGRWRALVDGPGYATSVFHDADGRPGVVSWQRGVADEAEGWAGALSRPQLLTRDGDRLLLVDRPPVG